MAVLELRNVTKKFGGVTALNNISLSVKENEIVGLIGPNGSGKTTAFNIISGFLKPDSDQGSIYFDGEDITGLKPHEICMRGVGRTFQIPKPLESFSVLDNVAVAVLAKKGGAPSRAREEAYQVLKFLGLLDKAYMMPPNLTLPDRKRLEVARALALEPRLLLLDEVLAGLTPSEIDQALELIKSINERGIAIMMVEHVMRAVMNVSERVIVLNEGRKIAEGPPTEISQNEEVIRVYLGRT